MNCGKFTRVGSVACVTTKRSMLKYFFQAMEGKLLAGRYRLISLLGEGGIGFVARAEQVSVGREVAIKFLSRSAHDADQIERFKREAKALATLKHPACLTLHDFDYSPDLECYYMVTELVDGVEFGEAIDAGMPLSEALIIMSHVCDALAAAHEQGVLHRDLKPQNVMVTRSYASPVKLLDFGLARLYQSTFGEDVKISRTGHVYGTPAYMSPEQCMADPNIGPATDIYSVGVMLYELCSGRLPFDTSTMTQMLLSHIREDAEPLDEPGIPEELRDLVDAMLKKDPSERPSDLYEVGVRLEEIAAAMSGEHRPVRRKTPSPMLGVAEAASSPDASGDGAFRTAPPDHPTLSGPPSEVSDAEHTTLEDLPGEYVVAPGEDPKGRGALVAGLTLAAVALLVVGATQQNSQGASDQVVAQRVELKPTTRPQARIVEVATLAAAVAPLAQASAPRKAWATREVVMATALPREAAAPTRADAPEARPERPAGAKKAPPKDAPAPNSAPEKGKHAGDEKDSATRRAKTLSFN
jgi:serine/threonine-protein kinase